MTYRVALIGPGRAGTGVATALVRAGHRVETVGGGSPVSRDRFCSVIAGVRAHANPGEAAKGAELVVLATPDDVLEQVTHELVMVDALREGQRIVHLAGAKGLAPLRRAALAGARTAACHPAQTFPAGATDPDRLLNVHWAVTATDANLGWATELVESIGGIAVAVPDVRRELYHAALTVGSNAVGAAAVVARQLLVAAGVSDVAAFLEPLIRASVDNVLSRGADALTGPVVRADTGTLMAHLQRLEADVPELADDYRALMGVVLSRARPLLRPGDAAELAALLGRPHDAPGGR